jgi:hypothetical protein
VTELPTCPEHHSSLPALEGAVQTTLTIYRIAAIQLLMEFEEELDAYFQYGHSDEEHWWIETTPEGERAMCYPVKLGLFLRLAHVLFRPSRVRFECPSCGLMRHDHDAVHCKACGNLLHIPDEGAV